jgi:hypothetical protein
MTFRTRTNLELAIIELLNLMGATRIARVYETFADRFDHKHELMGKRHPELRWKNSIRQARRNLVWEGLISRSVRRGIWELTVKGKRLAILRSIPSDVQAIMDKIKARKGKR